MSDSQNNQEFLDELMGPPEESFFFRTRSSLSFGVFFSIGGREYRIGFGAKRS